MAIPHACQVCGTIIEIGDGWERWPVEDGYMDVCTGNDEPCKPPKRDWLGIINASVASAIAAEPAPVATPKRKAINRKPAYPIKELTRPGAALTRAIEETEHDNPFNGE